MSAKQNRDLLKADLWEDPARNLSDQNLKIKAPPPQKEAPAGSELIDLVPPDRFKCGRMPVIDAIKRRRSRRRYTRESLTLEELSYLLWATQGRGQKGKTKFRTVPSGGGRHPFETYLIVYRVETLAAGLYRYLPFNHQLCLLREGVVGSNNLASACLDQKFVARSAVVFVWAAIPYRTEWRYPIVSAKLIAQDSGHLCQNLYIACESINAGTCAVAAYRQREIDALVGVSGDDEFVVYLAPVGKVK
ncbi:MAG: SagB/ThcOx family dehydrogenase [Candidatus Zixiibacteriota bacterium]|nr:MAG: SagB/ThcOx family dehydrogenase [candidate division Zixibacteria bacterium]